MKSYIIHQIGQLPINIEKPIPKVADDEKLLKLKASALNHRDLWITKGLYPGIKLGAIMGADGCAIDEDGNEYIINPGLEWGNNEAYQSSSFRVLGVPDEGTFADYIAINNKYIVPKPKHLNALQGAALPLGGVTAYRAIFKRAKLQKGDKVLISGIGGGVALFAMQFALAFGCEVLVTSGSELKIAEAIHLGAQAGYSYHDPDWTKKLVADFGGVDVIIDSAAGSGFNQLVKICNPGARIAFYGGSQGKIDGLNPQVLFWKQISLLGSTMGSDQDFREMVSFVEQHQILPVIDQILPLDDLHQGFRELETSSQFGKIVFQH
jgi:NADPH:quinone reductase-like Zn-dependent oxidoreductase